MKILYIGLIVPLLIPGITRAATDPTSGIQQPASQPNILLILSDDQSVPHLGCLGDKAASTPNLDRFASQGMLFDKHFCVAPQCVPSRAGFVTGRSAVSDRITRFSSPLPADVPALPDLLRAHGYFSGICRRTYHLDGTGAAGGVTAQIYKNHPELRTFANRVDFLDVNSPRKKPLKSSTSFSTKCRQKNRFSCG